MDQGRLGKLFLVQKSVVIDNFEMKFIVVSLFSVFSFLNVSQADQQTVRLRLFANLSVFPVIANARVQIVSDTIWSAEGLNLIFNEKKLATKNFIIKKSDDKFDIISVFDFDSYIAGVISKEMPLNWPLEALKAQAVVARSYALAKIKERQNKVFHLDTNQMDQVFAVTDSEKAKLAVFLTDQVILKDKKNKILKAFYHADCGGQTIPASKVWVGAVDSGTAVDPWCELRKSNEWTFETSRDNFYSKLLNTNSVVVEENFKGRIQSFRMLDEVISLQKLRQIFGFAEIKNSPMQFEQTASQILLKGKGFGHGVGLCQWGALAQARLGRSYTQILNHYYPEAQLIENKLRLSKSFMADLVFN